MKADLLITIDVDHGNVIINFDYKVSNEYYEISSNVIRPLCEDKYNLLELAERTVKKMKNENDMKTRFHFIGDIVQNALVFKKDDNILSLSMEDFLKSLGIIIGIPDRFMISVLIPEFTNITQDDFKNYVTLRIN